MRRYLLWLRLIDAVDANGLFWTQTAGLGERTLRKLESGATKLRTPILRELADALNAPA